VSRPAHLKGHLMEFSMEAVLGYRVQQETPFVFKVQVQAFTGQTITSEYLRIESELQLEDWSIPANNNRLFQDDSIITRFQDYISDDGSAGPADCRRAM
jgi:hypothetical protein